MPEKQKGVALVTGASRGIGAEIAKRLAKDGFTVVVNYSNSSKPADEVVASVKEKGGNAISIKADVSNSADVAAMFDEIEKKVGKLSVLVNNAGIMKLAPVAQSEDAFFDQHMSINLKGAFNCMREASHRLVDGGRIVNFSSSVVGLYQPTYGVYAASKAAVEALTHILAKEMRGRQITVNAVAPGPVNTALFKEGKSQELINTIAKSAPLERLGEPEDIANVVSFLVGPDGGWVNGQILRTNGGVI